MYRMTCDGHPLLDTRDDDYILGNPKVKTAINTVGEASFKIYFNHPNIDKLIPLRSIFEVRDEYGAIFRGRMTEDTKDINNGKDVDLEGAMAFFNDSVVRPYVFPDDFEENAEYQAAAAETSEQAAIDGGVVRFYLKWLIDHHNEQVEPFQQFKLGNVTVYDKNNHIERASSGYPNTWAELSDKTFNSSLGGFLCIRYEDDGNYIDYLREFTEVNEQGIIYGENMIDISHNTDASGTYSAIIPLGADIESEESDGDVYEGIYGDIVGGSTVKKKLTIESLPDGDMNADIVKRGDILYSKSAVAAYGLRFAPREDTTWDDVTEVANLKTKGIEFLSGDSTKIPVTIKVTAVDLNCTDEQIRSFRIYKKIPVYTPAHEVDVKFDLTALDIALLDPQKTKITAGKAGTTFTDFQSKQQNILNMLATNKKVETDLKKTINVIEQTFVPQKTLEETLSGYAPVSALSELVSSKTLADTLKSYATTDEVLSEEQVQHLIDEALKKKEPDIPDNLELITPPTTDNWNRPTSVLDNLNLEGDIVQIKPNEDYPNRDCIVIDCEYLAHSTNKHIDARYLEGYVIYTDTDTNTGVGSTVIKYDASKETAAPFYRISLEFCAVDGREYPVFDATYFYTDYSTLKEKDVSEFVYKHRNTTNCSIDIEVEQFGLGNKGAEFKIKFELDRPVVVYKMHIYPSW